MDNAQAFSEYQASGHLPKGFLGLDGAPRNNLKFYKERESFARWVAKEHAVSVRAKIESSAIAYRIGMNAKRRGALEPMLRYLVPIAILESHLTNAGYGRDRFGTSLAVGPMQTKWAPFIDAGMSYEDYLDVVMDINPLLGVDAGVGYYLLIARRFGPHEAIAKYNDPRTNSATNTHYMSAFNKACSGTMFGKALSQATEAFKGSGQCPTCNDTSRRGTIR